MTIWEKIFNDKLRAILLQDEVRTSILEKCKTQAQKDKWLDRWAIEDAANNIASAIRSGGFRF